MTNYRTELRIPVERNNKSVINNDYTKHTRLSDTDSVLPSDETWKYDIVNNNDNNRNNWDTHNRHTLSNEQIYYQRPWNKHFRTISSSPLRFTETTDHFFDDMKRRIEERRRRWNEEFKIMHNDLRSSNHLRSSTDLFNDNREVMNSSNGSVHFVANFNLSNYDPELVKVFVHNGQLVVTAKTERNQSTNSLNNNNNNNDNKKEKNSTSSLREYSRSINLPSGINDEKISAVLSLNGILTVSCPMKPPPFSSSTDIHSIHSETSFNPFLTRKHYQSSRKLSQQYPSIYEIKSPKFNYSSTHSLHSDYDILSPNDENDFQHSTILKMKHNYHPQSTFNYQQLNKRRFCLQLPVDTDYSPAEIQIKTLNHRIYVKARHEERTSNRTAVREFSKEYDIPDNVDPESLTAKFSNGILYIEEPIV
ncbi:unnamed protein product [Heterobilharzia americana]|nr:unnamed protein product [Heterobilharzia americana]